MINVLITMDAYRLTFLMELFTSVDDELLWSAAKPGLNYLIYNLKREPAFETFRVGNYNLLSLRVTYLILFF